MANERERERRRERERERERGRETETETERERDRDRERQTERQRQGKLIAVERKSGNLTLESLLNDNCNTQNLLSGFNIKEELLMALSEKKVSILEEKDKSFFVVNLILPLKISWKYLRKE